MKVAAHVDERLHEHDEEGVHTEWERKQVVLPSRGYHSSQGAGSGGAHRAAAHQEGGSRVDAAAANVGRPRHAHRTYRATNSAHAPGRPPKLHASTPAPPKFWGEIDGTSYSATLITLRSQAPKRDRRAAVDEHSFAMQCPVGSHPVALQTLG